MDKVELVDALVALEKAKEELTIDERIKADLYELGDEAEEVASLLIEAALIKGAGNPMFTMQLLMMGALELGRELERRV